LSDKGLGALLVPNAQGQSFYVKPGGNDQASGTDDANAWGTITKVNAALANGTIGAGAQVLFKKDGTYAGRINLDGRTGITFDAYGTGSADPVISGAVAITSWDAAPVPVSGGFRWSADVAGGHAQLHGVFQGTVRQTLAREPDAGWFFIDSWTNNSLTDSDLGGTGIDWTQGGQAVIRASNWRYDVVPCTGQTGNTIQFDPISLPGNPAPTGTYNWGYFLQNELDAANTPGEWYYELVGGQGRLHFVTNDGINAPLGVEVAVLDRCMDIRRSNNIIVKHITFTRAVRGIKLYGDYGAGGVEFPVNGVTVDHCAFSQLFRGVDDDSNSAFMSNFGHIYQWNRFDEIGDAAIWTSATDCQVKNNTVNNCGLWPGWGSNGWGYIGIRSIGPGTLVENNLLTDIGYIGISIGGTGAIVRRNLLQRAMMSLNDGGGISMDNSDALLIEQNIVVDMVGNVESTAANYPANEPITTGIYFGDQHLLNVTARDNTVMGCTAGMYLDHNHLNASIAVGQKHRIQSNTLFGNTYAQLSISDNSNYRTGQLGAPQGAGGFNFVSAYPDEYQGNILYTLRSDQWCMTQESVWAPVSAPLVDFGELEGNYYFNPFNSAAILQTYKYLRNGVESYLPRPAKAWSLNGWRDRFSEESTGICSPLQLTDYAVQSLGVENSILTQDLNSSSWLTPWSASSATPDPSFLTFTDGAQGLRLSNGNWLENWGQGYTLTASSMNAVSTTWLATYRLRSSDTDMIGIAPLWSNATGRLISVQYADLRPEWHEFSFVVDVPNSSSVVVANILSNVHWGTGPAFTNTSTIDLDLTRFEPCTLDPDHYATEVLPNHRLFFHCPLPGSENDPLNVASSGGNLTIPGNIGQCWSDVFGNFYAAGDQIPLDEWASIVLFRMDVAPANLALDGNGEHHITANTLWTDNMNVEGSVVVDAGATLSIDGAHIGFAESTPTLTTNITVQPGGTLILRNGATLRNWMGCGSAPIMWDGVKVLGNGTTAGAGLVQMESGARISDALTAIRCAEGQPNSIFGGDAQAGGVVQATNAVFENNLYDIVTRPHTVVNQAEWGPSSFTHCTFRRTRPLHNQQLPPGARVSLMQSASTPFSSCTFENTTGDYKGMGIHAIGTRVRVEGGEAPQARSRFSGLDFAMLHSAYDPTHLADVDRSDFTDNKRGLMIWGADNCKVTRSTFTVADAPANYSGIDGVYGAYLYGCSGFEVEENTFTGTGTAHPKVGLVLRNTGIADNMFYNNRFSGFADASERSCGTVIMGQNATADLSVGLRLKCNDYATNATNNYDVAFTGNAVSIADQQGLTGQGSTYPAGNTFALVDPLTCNGNEARHLYEDVEFALNAFSYYHHLPQAQLELVPQCNNVQVASQNTFWDYEKPISCPVDLSGLVPIGDDESTAGGAHAEHDVLVAVYDNWKDGGNTDGLIDFIKDAGNSSYAVRNQLMLVAPKVSYAAWKECFIRTPAMNPWHLAQALLANSPLEPATLTLLHQSDIDPFYKELVEDGQNGGQSMHSIYKSEIAHFHGVKSGALQAAVRKSLLSGNTSDAALTLQALQDYPITGGEQVRFGLLLATSDLATARAVVDERLLAGKEDKDLWQVYDLLLGLREQSKAPSDLDGSGISQLQSIAANGGMGAAQAEAWLALLGNPTSEEVLLPNRNKSLKPQRERPATSARPLLAAYPNPSNGPVYITYTELDGVENVELQVHDAQGRLLKRQRVGNNNGIAELQPRELSTGVHVASLYFDGIRVGSTKLNLVK
jgi:hypothetical protein